jgi:hypothetical protein
LPETIYTLRLTNTRPVIIEVNKPKVGAETSVISLMVIRATLNPAGEKLAASSSIVYPAGVVPPIIPKPPANT